MTPEHYSVKHIAGEADYGEVWRGFAQTEAEACSFAAFEQKLPLEQMKAEIVDNASNGQLIKAAADKPTSESMAKSARKVGKVKGQPRVTSKHSGIVAPTKKVRNRGVFFASTNMTICQTKADLDVYLDSLTEDARKLVRIGQGTERKAERQYKLKGV